MIKSEQVFEAICKLGSYYWGISETTSSEAISEALSKLGSKPGNSP